MPIVALPPTTVRAIGSTSIISDPCSIIKELLDNALDASASSVIIEISQDTVGTIQVKDNGHGIPSSDHTLVCKRAFTSKIQTVKDLQNAGGKSLGFRGEALASAAEVSTSLIVATRVESEPVGSSLLYARTGELVSTEHVAHPVGTTVRISGLFKHIPVRRQTATKNCKKTLPRIRKMIQAYAMARPGVRLSFKVLNSKVDSGNWIYAPGKDAGLMGAALKVVGTDVASNCMLKQWPASPQGVNSSGNTPGFMIFALLPKLGSDYTKFNNSGQYISIDERPVSAGRGIAQDIVKLYKTYLRSISSHCGPNLNITDPFVCVHIKCPEGSYDVNVEPSKDDVLFEDKKAVLLLVESLLRDAYGEIPQAHASECDIGEETDPSRRSGPGAHLGRTNDSTPLSRTRDIISQHEGFANARSFAHPAPPRASPPEARIMVERQLDNLPSIQPRRFGASNVIPTLNSTGQRQSSPRRLSGRASGLFPRSDKSTSHTSPREGRQSSIGETSLPSPVSSMGSPPSGAASRSPLFSQTSPSSPGVSQMSPTTPVRSGCRQHQREHDRERSSNGSLDTWFLKLTQASRMPEAIMDSPEQKDEPSLSLLSQKRFGDSVSPTSPSNERAPRNEFASAGSSFSPASAIPGPSSPRTSTATRLSKRQDTSCLEERSTRSYDASDPNQNPELRVALEFENRKKAAIQEKRMQLKTTGSSGGTNSPHLNRYRTARAALNSDNCALPNQSDATGFQSSKPALSPHDPRAYLMRYPNTETMRQNNSKIKRIPSSKLPFEKVPDGHDLHDISIKWPAQLSLFSTSIKNATANDLYTQSGTQPEAFNLPDTTAAIELEVWKSQLLSLTRAHYRLNDTADIPNLQFDFSGITRISDNLTSNAVAL
ncbi:hypothetical protein BJX99DRAFT_223224 [Aspergillus californicus]